MVATVIEAHCEGKNTYWQERDSLLIEEGQRTLAPRERTIDLLKYLGVLYRVLFQDIHFARVARRSWSRTMKFYRLLFAFIDITMLTLYPPL